jgi:hypothetical protein
MSGLCASPRSRHLKPGTPVQHQTMGLGRIIGEWGPVSVVLGKATRVSYPCPGIYDVEFPNRVLQCCRVEYLERIAIARSDRNKNRPPGSFPP